MMIAIRSEREILKMKHAGAILGECLLRLEELVKPGVTTYELDIFAEQFILKHNGLPAFKGVEMPGTFDFPASICASVNDQIVHGIPSKKTVLKDGDIISIDCGVLIDGYFSDAARTFAVGNISDEAEKLINVTRESFFKAADAAVEGKRVYNISAAVEDYVTPYGFSIVRSLVGHGIGQELWEEPQIPNYKTVSKGPRLRNGMVLAIEPMINVGDYHTKTLSDGWTVVTIDGSLSAHYENTVVLTENGPEIITLGK